MRIRGRRVLLLFWMMAAPLLLAMSLLSVFWTVSGPDTTIAATIVDTNTELKGEWSSDQGFRYFVDVVDDDGYRHKIRIYGSQLQKVSQGFSLAMETRSFQKTTITYHREAVAGLLLPRRVATHLEGQPVITGNYLQGLNNALAIITSAFPAATLGWLWINYLGRARGWEREIERMKMEVWRMVTEKPGASHTELSHHTELSQRGTVYLREAAIRQLLDEGVLRCENGGRGRKYFVR